MDTTGKTCPYCAETIKAVAVKCRYCGEFLDEDPLSGNAPSMAALGTPVNRGAAAAMSLVWPGMGHVFQGRLVLGFTAMALAGFFLWLGLTTGIIGWVILLCIYVGIVHDTYNFEPGGPVTGVSRNGAALDDLKQGNRGEQTYGK